MESLTLTQSNRRLLALPISLAIVLATLLLLAVLSPVRGNEEPTIAASYANQGTASLSSSPVITIGVGTWLSNPEPGGWDWGWAEANSVQLAISQTNAAGGINVGGITYTLVLVAADDGCQPTQQAITAANTLLNAGAVAVVGHGCSGASMVAQPLYNAAGVAMISPSSTDPQITQQGYAATFRTISHDGAGPTLLATYFRSWLSLSRSAIVDGPDRWWGNQIGDIYSDTFTALGGTITSRREVASASEFTATLTAIMAENPDVIYYIGRDPIQAGQFSLSAYTLGMTNVVIGWSGEGDDSVLTGYAGAAGAAAAENDYVALQYRRFEDMPGWATFLSAYQAANFPHEPNNPGTFGAFAYDAARIIMAAIDRADSTNPVAIRSQIAAAKNYEGIVGTYRGFDACGDVIPQWAWLERYQNGQWIFLVQSAPASSCSRKIFLPIVLRDF